MDITVSNIAKRLRSFTKREFIMHRGVKLPPCDLRLMGERFKDDQFYLDSMLYEGKRFIKRLNVTEDTVLLEMGCGSGRSLMGLILAAGRIKRYVGIDVKQRNLQWTRKYIGGKYDFCEFHHIDLRHILYNPKGSEILDEDFRFDFGENIFDIIYLHSVFANSLDEEIRIFAREFFRVMKPGGILFLTAFIEENVPDMTENPENYVMQCNYPRQVVRFEKNYFLSIFTGLHFIINSFEHGTEVDSQSAVYFRKPG